VNCVQSDLSEWGECEYDIDTNTYVKRQRRTTTTPALYGGTPCLPLTEEETCPAVNCVQSGWTNSGGCNSSTGKQSQIRTTTTAALNGGTACGNTTRNRNCDVNCVMNEWTNSGGCNSSTGKQKQTRTVKTAAQHSGTACPPNSDRVRYQDCAVNCVGDWGAWSDCTETCGTGTQTQSWIVSKDEINGGTCVERGTTQKRDCNTQACHVTLDKFTNNKLYLKTKDGTYLGISSYGNRVGNWRKTNLTIKDADKIFLHLTDLWTESFSQHSTLLTNLVEHKRIIQMIFLLTFKCLFLGGYRTLVLGLGTCLSGNS